MSYARDVFINCPFDAEFARGFDALVFAVLACGFRARCAREMDDSSQTRIDKLYGIVEQSKFGIHDLSRTELDENNHLPRFNMPLELGLFLGAKRFGDKHQKLKRCLILDTEQYRYQKFISDIAGMDITAHNGDPRAMVVSTRNWLATVSKRSTIPGPAEVTDSYNRFITALPDIARNAGLESPNVAYPDYERLVRAWLGEEGLAAT